jgi:hypothetical protein
LAAVLWGGVGFALALSGFASLQAWIGLPNAVAAVSLPLSIALGTALWGRALWRGRRVRSRFGVALWLEERVPSLRYALVTLADPYCSDSSAALRLEGAVRLTSWTGPMARALVSGLLVPAAALALALTGLGLLPAGAVAVISRPSLARDGPGPEAAAGPGALGRVVARVRPPAYTRLPAFTLDEPASVAALAGSEVVFDGSASAAGVSAWLAGSALTVADLSHGWRVQLAMPREPAALVLSGGGEERVVVLEARPDSIPVVTLRSPPRDSVLREVGGPLEVAVDVADDFGLAASWLELIVSSGERERYTFRTAVVGRAPHAGLRRAERRVRLPLDSLRLLPGDVLHLRAVATDLNAMTGPGAGVSETRTFRVARPGEYDSVSVEGLPALPEDTSALSQRMLIMLAEALQRRRPRLTRERVWRESRDIGADQARLRRRVADVIFTRLSGEASAEETEGEVDRAARTPEEVMAAAESAASRQADAPLDFAEDESPVVAVNRPLLEAYNAMWEAGRQLELGEPDDALPHMRAALAAIQRARRAERLYLRGRPPSLVVDLARVRLAGDRSGVRAGARSPGPAAPGSKGRLRRRLESALAALPRPEALDSLLLLRVEALGSEPSLAAALGEAALALRAGRDATVPLLRAREALAARRRTGPLSAWEGAW